MISSARFKLLGVLALSSALVSLALACGDDPTDAPAGAPDASSSDAPVTPPPPSTPSDGGVDATELEAFCAGTLGLRAPRYAECCSEADAPQRYRFDHGLLSGLGLECTESLGKSLAANRVTFVASAAQTCATNVSTELAARSCPEVVRAPTNEQPKTLFNEAEGCADVIVGRQSEGAPCARDYECQDGLTCVGWTPDGDGVCKTPPGDGELCGNGIPDGSGFFDILTWGFGSHPRCAAGFTCSPTAFQQGTCKAQQPAGGECDAHEECLDGLRCQNGSCSTDGPGPAAAPCERTSDCQGGLFCKFADGGSCTPRGVAGDECTSDLSSECQGACVREDGGPRHCVAYCGSQ